MLMFDPPQAKGVGVGACVGRSGVGGDLVVGAGSVVVVKINSGCCVRRAGVGRIGEGAGVEGNTSGVVPYEGIFVRERWFGDLRSVVVVEGVRVVTRVSVSHSGVGNKGTAVVPG